MFAAATAIATLSVTESGSVAEYFASYSASPASSQREDWDLLVMEEAGEFAPYLDLYPWF